MRLIDADALIPMMKYATTDSEIGIFPIRIGFESIVKVIESAPTIDAVEVVRCKDCRYYNTTNCCDGCGWCERSGMDRGTWDNWFCADGERKEGE